MSSFRRRLMMMHGGGKSALEPCIYTTTSANQRIEIVNNSSILSRITLEDGTDIPITQSQVYYTFPEAGDHKVFIEINPEETQLGYIFTLCVNLKSVGANLFSNNKQLLLADHCFSGCSGLTNIPYDLFANNTKITSFGFCFNGCTNLESPCPIDNDGTPIYNRSGNGKEGYALSTYNVYCFHGCNKMADYASIPSGWK